MVLKVVEKWVFWINPGSKGQYVHCEQMLVRFVCKEGESTGLFNCYALITLPEKQVASET